MNPMEPKDIFEGGRKAEVEKIIEGRRQNSRDLLSPVTDTSSLFSLLTSGMKKK